MKFSRIIGKIDQKLITAAEEKLSRVFLQLATGYTNQHVENSIGGDPLIFSLMYPIAHVATLNIPTAATDGKRYYWNPKFILKQHIIGLRIICAHEAWHSIYLHPSRRGSRLPKLWNIAVDYIVNGTVMDDFKARKIDPHEYFTKYLGRYMTLPNLVELLKDPFAAIPGFEDLKPGEAQNNPAVELPSANVDRELTPEEQKELEKREKRIKFYYADPDLPEDMKRPEKIYDLLFSLLPKRGDGIDIFDLGGTVDDHMDTEESEEKLAKRISDAMHSARRMAGHVPAALETELGQLTAPKITVWDVIRSRINKSRSGNSKNDWTRFRTRPMFTGLLIPKRKSYECNFGCLLDCSGSMTKEDISLGVSQLQSLDDRAEGWIVPADAAIYFEKATKIKKCSVEELSKVKICGRGGTVFGSFMSEYEQHIGKCDFLIVITDGFLLDTDLASMVDPGIPTYWIITSNNVSFVPPFGKVYHIRD